MTRAARLLLGSLLILGTGCSVFIPKETTYLHSARGKATQEDVRQNLGPPLLTATSKQGNPVWVYNVYFTDLRQEGDSEQLQPQIGGARRRALARLLRHRRLSPAAVMGAPP
jgi:hypothetical protein